VAALDHSDAGLSGAGVGTPQPGAGEGVASEGGVGAPQLEEAGGVGELAAKPHLADGVSATGGVELLQPGAGPDP